MNLIVINNLQTYFSLLNYNLNDKVILTTDIELCYQLQKKGKRFINLWRYLTDDIITETELKVQKISESFQTPFSKDFDYFGVSVFHISKIFLRYFYKACYHTFDTLKKLTSENNIHQVYINKANPVSLNVANYSETSILDSMSEYFYRLKNIEIKHFITSNQTIKSTRNINKGIKYSEFISDSLEDIVSRNINKKILYILSDNFEWDFDLIRYIKKKKNLDIYVVWRTPEIIKEEHNHYEWLPLFFSDFEFEDSKLINLYKEIDKSEQYFFNEFRKTNSEYVEIFNNKYLDFQFRDYYKRLKNYVKDLSTFDRIYDFIKPDI